VLERRYFAHFSRETWT